MFRSALRADLPPLPAIADQTDNAEGSKSDAGGLRHGGYHVWAFGKDQICLAIEVIVGDEGAARVAGRGISVNVHRLRSRTAVYDLNRVQVARNEGNAERQVEMHQPAGYRIEAGWKDCAAGAQKDAV